MRVVTFSPARAKAGTSKSAAADRRKRFVQHYIQNGRNATQAAIRAGFSKKTARSQGQRLLTDVAIRAAVDRAMVKYEEIVGLATERTLREVARVAYSDPGRTVDPVTGKLIPLHLLPEEVRATIKSVELRDGEVMAYQFWDKNAALEKAMKHQGLFERDNKQTLPGLAIQINLVGPEPEPGEIKITPRGNGSLT